MIVHTPCRISIFTILCMTLRTEHRCPPLVHYFIIAFSIVELQHFSRRDSTLRLPSAGPLLFYLASDSSSPLHYKSLVHRRLPAVRAPARSVLTSTPSLAYVPFPAHTRSPTARHRAGSPGAAC